MESGKYLAMENHRTTIIYILHFHYFKNFTRSRNQIFFHVEILILLLKCLQLFPQDNSKFIMKFISKNDPK